MNGYVIVLDLDGTLLNTNKSISEYNKEVLKKCKKLGCKIVINTSRNYNSSIFYKNEIKADYLICFNGNVILNDKIIYENKIDSELYNKIISMLNKNNFDYVVECFDNSYRNKKNEFFQIDTNFVDDLSKFENDCIKILVRCSDDETKNIIKKLSEYNLNFSYDSLNSFLRITYGKLNKWQALTKIVDKNEKIISFGDDSNDLELLKKSFIGIKMKNSTKSLNQISFMTDSNDNDGVGKFLKNYFNLDLRSFYQNIKVLDCSLRDGGHLNSSNFGYKNIKNIINNLVKSNIDIIELGFLEDCIYKKNIAKFNKVSETKILTKNLDNSGSIFALLMQADKYDITKLEKCNSNVKMIRVSFHNDIIDKGMEYCDKVKKAGYICACNPINFSGYSMEEIIKLIKKVNKVKPDYFTIVDTFGVLLNNDFINILQLLNRTLNKNIKLGLHLHNNLSLSFSTALMLINEHSRFDEIVIDTSILGMGRAPGNLNTELLTYYINKNVKEKYKMKYIYNLMENEILNFKQKYNWDINYIYSIASFEKCHRSYAEFLIKNNVNIKTSEILLKKIPEENKGRYDENIIFKIYSNYVIK